MAHSIEDRLRRRIDPAGPNYCWIWRGSLDTHGYAKMEVNRDGRRITTGAHRLAYEVWVGPIGEGLVIDHLCRNRACVNPGHLELVTPAENTRRGNARPPGDERQRDADGVWLCVRGHRLTLDNTYVRPSRPSVAECRICRAASRLAYQDGGARVS